MIQVTFKDRDTFKHLLNLAMLGEALQQENVSVEWVRFWDALDDYVVSKMGADYGQADWTKLLTDTLQSFDIKEI